ncbi:MAG: phosphatidylserine decarboxylase family protein [Sedimentisphaerales bacterium]|nr:phosphatidylserine decarboxylase family protein [Sedimentisphaerales bacterium]
MKIPITRYGMPQVALLPSIILVAGAVSFFLWPAGWPWAQLAAIVLAAGVLAFFRDPKRQIPDEPNALLAPADGKVTDIELVSDAEFLEGPAIRIGIFLSVLDVHINRSPCAGRVGYVKSRAGKCINALRWKAASEKNQSNSVGLNCPNHPAKKVLIKQITGAIARRIVCGCEVGDELGSGEQFGMIKFGSRTELFFPVDKRAEVIVKIGQTVRAGTTVMVLYEKKEL